VSHIYETLRKVVHQLCSLQARTMCAAHLPATLWGAPLLLQQRNTSHHISHISGTLTTSHKADTPSPLCRSPNTLLMTHPGATLVAGCA